MNLGNHSTKRGAVPTSEIVYSPPRRVFTFSTSNLKFQDTERAENVFIRKISAETRRKLCGDLFFSFLISFPFLTRSLVLFSSVFCRLGIRERSKVSDVIAVWGCCYYFVVWKIIFSKFTYNGFGFSFSICLWSIFLTQGT